MRKYQLVIVFKPEAKPAEVLNGVKEEIETAGGKILSQDEPTQKKLAFSVDGFREGAVQTTVFTGPADVTSRLTGKLRVSEDVLRFLIKLEAETKVKE